MTEPLPPGWVTLHGTKLESGCRVMPVTEWFDRPRGAAGGGERGLREGARAVTLGAEGSGEPGSGDGQVGLGASK